MTFHHTPTTRQSAHRGAPRGRRTRRARMAETGRRSQL